MQNDVKQQFKARKVSLRLLKSRPRSEKEIRDYLLSKHYSHAVIEQVITYLKQSQTIDDNAFLKGWIDSRYHQVYSKTYITAELLQKGFSLAQIQEELNQAQYQSLEVNNLLAKWVQDQLSQIKTVKQQVRIKRLYRKILSRGFDPEAAQHALRSGSIHIGQ